MLNSILFEGRVQAYDEEGSEFVLECAHRPRPVVRVNVYMNDSRLVSTFQHEYAKRAKDYPVVRVVGSIRNYPDGRVFIHAEHVEWPHADSLALREERIGE